ncbi:MAG: hypothetical protein ACLSVD_07070 [Eggerthellaceae bacterium]
MDRSAAAPPASPTSTSTLTGMVELSQNGEPLFEPLRARVGRRCARRGSYGRAGRGEVLS